MRAVVIGYETISEDESEGKFVNGMTSHIKFETQEIAYFCPSYVFLALMDDPRASMF